MILKNIPSVRPNPHISTPFRPLEKPVFSRLSSWRDLPHITNKLLPRLATDIRGIDSAAYSYVDRKRMWRTLPTVIQNKFFTLKFFPALHHVCMARKSNIAYTFTNFSGPVLNDPDLLALFSKYSGKYKNLNFFKSQPTPFGTAALRIRNRKFIKRTLFAALHSVLPQPLALDISAVSGIWFFRFAACAATSEDILLVERDLEKAVSKVLRNKAFAKQVADVTNQHNLNQQGVKQLLRDVKLENTLGASRVPGYYPKLPFIHTVNRH